MAKKRTSARQLKDRLVSIAKKIPAYDVARARRKIEECRQLYAEACFVRHDCLAQGVVKHIPRLQLEVEELCIAHAFQGVDAAALPEALEYYAAYGYLLARMQQAVARKFGSTEFYTNQLEDLGLHAMAAVCTNAGERARWMCSEFLRHYDAGAFGESSFDEEFLATVAFVARWFVDGAAPVPHASLGAEFSPVSQTARSGDVAGFVASLTGYAAWREDVASGQVRQRGGDQSAFGDTFYALFPFEVVAAARLFESTHGVLPDTGFIPAWLGGLSLTGRPWSDDFVVQAERELVAAAS